MDMKKSMVTAAAIALLGTGTIGVVNTYAAGGNTGDQTQRFDQLIEALAERFDLNTEEVLEVFKEQREEMMKEHLEKRDERLEEAVTSGILTQEQADALREHRQEMHTFMESLKDMSPEDRKEASEAQREANETWAKEYDIPAAFLPNEGPHNQGPRGPHMQPNAE